MILPSIQLNNLEKWSEELQRYAYYGEECGRGRMMVLAGPLKLRLIGAGLVAATISNQWPLVSYPRDVELTNKIGQLLTMVPTAESQLNDRERVLRQYLWDEFLRLEYLLLSGKIRGERVGDDWNIIGASRELVVSWSPSIKENVGLKGGYYPVRVLERTFLGESYIDDYHEWIRSRGKEG